MIGGVPSGRSRPYSARYAPATEAATARACRCWPCARVPVQGSCARVSVPGFPCPSFCARVSVPEFPCPSSLSCRLRDLRIAPGFERVPVGSRFHIVDPLATMWALVLHGGPLSRNVGRPPLSFGVLSPCMAFVRPRFRARARSWRVRASWWAQLSKISCRALSGRRQTPRNTLKGPRMHRLSSSSPIM